MTASDEDIDAFMARLSAEYVAKGPSLAAEIAARLGVSSVVAGKAIAAAMIGGALAAYASTSTQDGEGTPSREEWLELCVGPYDEFVWRLSKLVATAMAPKQ